MSLEINCDDIPTYIKEAIQSSDDKAKTIIELADKNARTKELLGMRLEKHQKLEKLITTHPNGPRAGFGAIISNDTWAKAQNSNVEYKQKALQGYAEKFIPTLKQELSTTMWGLKRDVEGGRAFVKAVIDGDTSNPKASKMAGEANQLLEFLRTRFNTFGGDVGKLRTGKGYLPQSHDAVVIRKTPKAEWVNFTRGLLDEATLRDIDRGALDLDYVYDTIATGGLNKIGPGGGRGGMGKSVVNKHAEERVLDFKDADSWIAYQERFGARDPLATLDDHIRTMTTDMAMIEVLGPNPEAMFKTLLDGVKAKRTLAGEDKPGAGLDLSEKMWNVISGKVDRDTGGFAYAEALQSLRAMNTATLLGSATLSTITDPMLGAFTAAYRGMNPLTTLSGYAKNFIKSGTKKGFEEQQLMGLGADVFSSEVTRRYSELGSGFWATASEAVMRATMMNVLTESARMSFKAQFFKKLLGKKKIADLSVDEHIKLLEKVQEESDYAVIMGNSRARALSTQGQSKGTITGEVVRSSTQFMTFPATFMIMQGSRMFRQANSKLAYGAALFTTLTIGGALAMTAKDVSKGYGMREGFDPFSEDVEEKDALKFWGAAMAQGGGVGIVGDFLFSDVNRFGGSKAMTVGGPTVGTAGELMDLTYGNLQKAFDPDNPDTHFGSELVEFTNRHLNPAKVWYTQAAWDNYVVRNLKIMMDEDYERAERKKERKRKKEYGQEKPDWLIDSREAVTETLGIETAQEAVSETTEKLAEFFED